ncbi:AraC family transcriptional regulator [Nocardiaceae bacterium YC2-7]|uniref:AraC family transcriptional regulator n=2 Tax=Antrihabitans stalactiti TaxID=2584121 RepID=A0A848KQZ1_9NOCA|nr:AraC family transcriptional regulator [Antrihabitans stalactiti]NMN99002.1 AraC family transcriptional regulator [Antrihabitans stalactiti]
MAVEHGMPLSAVLAGTKLTRADLDDLDREISFRDELKIITNMLDTLGDSPDLGIEAGLRCHSTSPGIWGLALMSAKTLREAISIGLPLAALSFCLCRLSLVPDPGDGSLRIVLDPSDLPLAVRRFALDRDMTGIRTLQCDLLASSDVPLDATYTTAPPTEKLERKYKDIFGTMPLFGAAENSLTVVGDWLDVPLPKANEHTKSMAERQAWELLRQRSARAGVAGLLRDLMFASPTPVVSLDEAARQLTLSTRTLRRYLAMEGVSLRTLQEEVREALAEELLVTDGLAVAQVADRLGYSQVSSFTQAFRRWKGVGPREYRQNTKSP